MGGQLQAREPLADVERNRVARTSALSLGLEVDREIAHLRLGAQIVVAHQAVEVERRRRARIGLYRGQLGQVLQSVGRRHQDAVCVFERRAARQIDENLNLRLVVERQELDCHVLGDEERACGQRRCADADEKDFRPHPALEQRRRDADIEPAHRANVSPMRFRVPPHRFEPPPRNAQQEPRRHRHRHEEREQHRHRGVRRNRAHVRAHQAADEHHRQQRRNNREGSDDGRIADLGDGLDGGVDKPAFAARRPTPDDILDDDDRVVDEDADREDEREQADAIDRVAHHPGRKERQKDGGRDDDQHDRALAPADRRGDEDHDRHGGEGQMKQKLVCLLVGCIAIVARDRNLEARGNNAPLDRLQPAHHVGCDGDGVLALALCDREADGGPALQLAGRAEAHRPGAMLGLGGPDPYIGDVLHIDGPAVARREQQQSDVGNALERLARDDRHGSPVVAERAGQE